MFFKNIDKVKLNNMIKENKNIVLLDVRENYEFKEKNIKNSINIPLHELMFRVDELYEYKNSEIVCICSGGKRSMIACQTLYEEGFLNLYNLEKGLNNYFNLI